MRIVVYGRPAPMGSKSFKGMAGKHAILVESSKYVRPWRIAVSHAAHEARNGAPPLDEALIVRMIFTLRKPQSAPKNRRTFPSREPDLSKLIRSTEDALTDAGVWVDDARVVCYERAAKVYPNEGDPEALDSPGVVITIRKREEGEPFW